MPPNPGTLGGTIGSPDLLFGGSDVFGGGNAAISGDGPVAKSIPGVAGALAPGSTAADIVVATFTLPAGSLDAAGRTLVINALGAFAANGNNKRVKIWFNATTAVIGSAVTGGTVVADTGTVATNGGGWSLTGYIAKRGVAGANTQTVASANGVATLADTTAVESGPILCAVTINNTTTVTDAVLAILRVIGSN